MIKPLGKSSRILKKILASALSVFLFITQVVLSHAIETNFWAGLAVQNKAIAANNLPSVSANLWKPQMPRSIKNLSKELLSRPDIQSFLTSFSADQGTVRSVKLYEGKPRKTVIHIQDVHSNPEAQLRIGQAIQSLIDTKHVDLLALEGAFTPFDISKIRELSDQKPVRMVADYLLNNDLISGAVHTAFTSQASIPIIVGVDSEKNYWANIDAYRRSAERMDPIKKQLSLKKLTLSKEMPGGLNPELHSFHEQVEKYRKGELNLGAYVRYLSQLSPQTSKSDFDVAIEAFLQAYALETNLNFSRVETDRAQLLSQLLKKMDAKETEELLQVGAHFGHGQMSHVDFYSYVRNLCEYKGISMSSFPAMRDYLHYILLADSIDVDQLFLKVERMEKNSTDSFVETPEEKRLMDLARSYDLIGRLTEFALTRNEWNEYKKIATKKSPEIQEMSLSSFEDFYREAELRDDAMLGNLLAEMDRTGASTAVLVTGGFHSDGIDRGLNKKGISTISFTPKLTKIDTENGTSYLSAFSREKTPLEQLFKGDKLFVPKVPVPSLPTTSFVIALVSEFLNPGSWPNSQKILDIPTDSQVQRTGDSIAADGVSVGISKDRGSIAWVKNIQSFIPWGRSWRKLIANLKFNIFSLAVGGAMFGVMGENYPLMKYIPVVLMVGTALGMAVFIGLFVRRYMRMKASLQEALAAIPQPPVSVVDESSNVKNLVVQDIGNWFSNPTPEGFQQLKDHGAVVFTLEKGIVDLKGEVDEVTAKNLITLLEAGIPVMAMSRNSSAEVKRKFVNKLKKHIPQNSSALSNLWVCSDNYTTMARLTAAGDFIVEAEYTNRFSLSDGNIEAIKTVLRESSKNRFGLTAALQEAEREFLNSQQDNPVNPAWEGKKYLTPWIENPETYQPMVFDGDPQSDERKNLVIPFIDRRGRGAASVKMFISPEAKVALVEQFNNHDEYPNLPDANVWDVRPSGFASIDFLVRKDIPLQYFFDLQKNSERAVQPENVVWIGGEFTADVKKTADGSDHSFAGDDHVGLGKIKLNEDIVKFQAVSVDPLETSPADLPSRLDLKRGSLSEAQALWVGYGPQAGSAVLGHLAQALTSLTNRSAIVSNAESNLSIEKLSDIDHEVQLSFGGLIDNNEEVEVVDSNVPNEIILKNKKTGRELKLSLIPKQDQAVKINKKVMPSDILAVRIGGYPYTIIDQASVAEQTEENNRKVTVIPLGEPSFWLGNVELLEWAGRTPMQMTKGKRTSVAESERGEKYLFDAIGVVPPRVINPNTENKRGSPLAAGVVDSNSIEQARRYLTDPLNDYSKNKSEGDRWIYLHFLSVLIRSNAVNADGTAVEDRGYGQVIEDRLLATQKLREAAEAGDSPQMRSQIERLMWSSGILMVRAPQTGGYQADPTFDSDISKFNQSESFTINEPDDFERLGAFFEELMKRGKIKPFCIINIKNFSPENYLAYLTTLTELSAKYNGNITFILSVERLGTLAHDMPGGTMALRRTADVLGKQFFEDNHVMEITDGGSKTRGGTITNAYGGQFSQAPLARAVNGEIALTNFLNNNLVTVGTAWLQAPGYGRNLFAWPASDGIIQFGTNPGMAGKNLSQLPPRFMGASGPIVRLLPVETVTDMRAELQSIAGTLGFIPSLRVLLEESKPMQMAILGENLGSQKQLSTYDEWLRIRDAHNGKDIDKKKKTKIDLKKPIETLSLVLAMETYALADLFGAENAAVIEAMKKEILEKLPAVQKESQALKEKFSETLKTAKDIFSHEDNKLNEKGNFIPDPKTGGIIKFVEKPSFAELIDAVVLLGDGATVMNIFFVWMDKQTMWDIFIVGIHGMKDPGTGEVAGQRWESMFDLIFGGSTDQRPDPVSVFARQYFASHPDVHVLGINYGGEGALAGDIGNLDANQGMYGRVTHEENLRWEERFNVVGDVPENVRIIYVDGDGKESMLTKKNPQSGLLFVLKNVKIQTNDSSVSYVLRIGEGSGIFGSIIRFGGAFTTLDLGKNNVIVDSEIAAPLEFKGEMAIAQSVRHEIRPQDGMSTVDLKLLPGSKFTDVYEQISTLVAYGGETMVTVPMDTGEGVPANYVVRAWNLDYKAPIIKVAQAEYKKAHGKSAESAYAAFEWLAKIHPALLNVDNLSTFNLVQKFDEQGNEAGPSLYDLAFFAHQNFEKGKSLALVKHKAQWQARVRRETGFTNEAVTHPKRRETLSVLGLNVELNTDSNLYESIHLSPVGKAALATGDNEKSKLPSADQLESVLIEIGQNAGQSLVLEQLAAVLGQLPEEYFDTSRKFRVLDSVLAHSSVNPTQMKLPFVSHPMELAHLFATELKDYQLRTNIKKLRVGIMGVGDGKMFYYERLYARALGVNARYLTVDRSIDRLNATKELFQGMPDVEFMDQDLLMLNPVDGKWEGQNSFDYIHISHAMHEVFSEAALLSQTGNEFNSKAGMQAVDNTVKNFSTLLRSGGLLVFLDGYIPNQPETINVSLKTSAAENAFKIMKAKGYFVGMTEAIQNSALVLTISNLMIFMSRLPYMIQNSQLFDDHRSLAPPDEQKRLQERYPFATEAQLTDVLKENDLNPSERMSLTSFGASTFFEKHLDFSEGDSLPDQKLRLVSVKSGKNPLNTVEHVRLDVPLNPADRMDLRSISSSLPAGSATNRPFSDAMTEQRFFSVGPMAGVLMAASLFFLSPIRENIDQLSPVSGMLIALLYVVTIISTAFLAQRASQGMLRTIFINKHWELAFPQWLKIQGISEWKNDKGIQTAYTHLIGVNIMDKYTQRTLSIWVSAFILFLAPLSFAFGPFMGSFLASTGGLVVAMVLVPLAHMMESRERLGRPVSNTPLARLLRLISDVPLSVGLSQLSTKPLASNEVKVMEFNTAEAVRSLLPGALNQLKSQSESKQKVRYSWVVAPMAENDRQAIINAISEQLETANVPPAMLQGYGRFVEQTAQGALNPSEILNASYKTDGAVLNIPGYQDAPLSMVQPDLITILRTTDRWLSVSENIQIGDFTISAQNIIAWVVNLLKGTAEPSIEDRHKALMLPSLHA